MNGKDLTIYVTDEEMQDLRRWHLERGGNPDYSNENIIVGSLHLYWLEKRKDEIWRKYYGPGGLEDYASYTRAIELLKRKETRMNDPMIDELDRLWSIKQCAARETEWENGPDDHRLYPENNKDCKR